jgi:hypothetical protein
MRDDSWQLAVDSWQMLHQNSVKYPVNPDSDKMLKADMRKPITSHQTHILANPLF